MAQQRGTCTDLRMLSIKWRNNVSMGWYPYIHDLKH